MTEWKGRKQSVGIITDRHATTRRHWLHEHVRLARANTRGRDEKTAPLCSTTIFPRSISDLGFIVNQIVGRPRNISRRVGGTGRPVCIIMGQLA